LLPLRYPKVWFVLGCLLVVGVVAGSLLPANVVNAVVTYNDKIMHAGSYFVLMVWFAGLYRRALYPVIGAVLLALGVSLDLLQGLTATRSLDIYDIAANSVGVLMGLGLSALLLEGWCQRLERRLLT
jgi:VanZ family protein